jgi:hypothetical protein
MSKSGGIKTAQEFDLGFLGLNGTIGAEVAQAQLSGKNDITKIPDSARYITDKKNGAVLYNQAQRIMKIAWDQEMRREGVKYFSGNYTEDHPPTLLKDTDAAVIAQLTEALAPDIKACLTYEQAGILCAKIRSGGNNAAVQGNASPETP